MAISEDYINSFEQAYIKLVYNMMRHKLFLPVGLELNSTSVYFETDADFEKVGLKDYTFAYYNPIQNSININIEHPFFSSCTNNNERNARLFFILFHEANHKILMHKERCNNRNSQVWNMAADFEIHNMYYIHSKSFSMSDDAGESVTTDYLKIIDKFLINKNYNKKNDNDPANPEFLFDTNFLEKIAEEIYQYLENSKEENTQSFSIPLDSFMKQTGDNGQQSDNGNSEDNADNSGNKSDGDKNASNSGNSESESDSNGGKNATDTNSNSKNGKSHSANGDGDSEDGISDNNENKIAGNNSSGSGSQMSGANGNGKFANSSSGSSNSQGQSSSEVSVSVTKTTYRFPDGKKYTQVDIKWPENNMLPDKFKKTEEQNERERQNHVLNRSLVENNLENLAKNKGNLPADCQQFLKKLFHIKIDWTKILRNSLQTVLEKSDYFAWNNVRTSTFLLPGMPYLPDIVEDEEKYGTLIVSRDESGSMSNEEIEKAGAIILEAKEFYKKIVLLKHDYGISKIYEFEDINSDVISCLLKRERCGGTSHKEVFEYLSDYRKKHAGELISCYIGISDLESDIESYQNLIPTNIPVIWLAPLTAENRFESIRGKVIPVEL